MKAVLFIFSLLPFTAMSLAAQEKTINLLISEHHADHMGFFLRYGEPYGLPNNSERPSAAMIVLDAHADTVANERASLIRRLAANRDFNLAVEYTGNHDWIHPLARAPMVELAWISTIRGEPRADKRAGFQRSTSGWERRVDAYTLSLEDLRARDVPARMLFVSVDLDIFYSEYHALRDVPAVLDELFAFASRGQHPSVWAFCLSRAWLPNDDYAWALLEQTLRWLNSRPEFRAPEITLFENYRFINSRTAQAFRAEGREMPFLREYDMPESIGMLIWELQERE